MNINKVAKIGLAIQSIALGMMIILVLLSKAIPNVVIWIFTIGMAISLAGTVVTLSKGDRSSNKTHL